MLALLEHLRRENAVWVGHDWGSYNVPPSDSDADLLAHARRAGQTHYHPTSTCAIGKVVDPELRVYGLTGCAWSTHPSCPRSYAATPTPPPS
jgi:hypothetical protein